MTDVGRQRILVLVRGRRDGELTRGLLTRTGFAAELCGDVSELCAKVAAGAAVVLVAEEMLSPSAAAMIRKTLDTQPVWSDLPVIVFSSVGAARARFVAGHLQQLGNVTFLERPIQVRSMLAAVRAACRSRNRQYESGSAIDSRDAFLAMLGHELRNPLGAIRLASTLLGTTRPGADIAKEVGVIERQSVHLSRIVDEILDVARVTRGKIVLKLERLSLVASLRNAHDLMKDAARERLARFDLIIEGDPVLIDGDRQRLEQIFTNLFTNAIKYTQRGGSVVTRLRAEGDEAVISVEDNGVGLAPEMCERVFDIFAQAERSLDRAQGGIGLGLSLVRGIAELHGGTVRAKSDGLGKGSTFVLTLPRASSASLPTKPSAPAPVPTPAKRIVVVEDNADLRELLVALLQSAGHDVTSAEAGPEGVEKILATTPDIAFVDIGLPEMDGLEVARRVRAARSRARLVAMTGYGQPEDKARALAAGFDAHLTKPIESADLNRAILATGA